MRNPTNPVRRIGGRSIGTRNRIAQSQSKYQRNPESPHNPGAILESHRNGRTNGPENIEPGRGTHQIGTLFVSNHSRAVHHSIKGTTHLQTHERQNSIPKAVTRQLDPATKTNSKPQNFHFHQQ